jgi:hypothetical protein
VTFEFERGKLYRMPVVFGPTCGPRQVPDGVVIDDARTHRRTTITLTFDARARSLEALLPPRFALRGQPRLVVELSYMYEIDWLAGRGYNMLGVRIPVTFAGEAETIHGQFLTVLWESLADPILSGRDELGFAKLYAEIPEPRIFQGRREYAVGWSGFTFFDLVLDDVTASDAAPPPDPQHQGTLHWKYVLETGRPREAAVSCVTLTPAANPAMRVTGRSTARARARFHRARWEDLPTMFHIVNVLADLVDGAPASCAITESRGYKDLSDQRVVS